MAEEINKITESEMVIGGSLCAGLDGACALIDLTGIGIVTTPIVQSFATFGITLWLKNKGDTSPLKPGREMVKYASNFLPVLPTLTVIFAFSAYMHNHPEKFGAVKTFTGPATKPAIANIKTTPRNE